MDAIPKVIHYCWFGRGPKPQSVLDCIASWHKFMPDYQVKEWNEDNFDVSMTKYVEEAYRAGSYAHVSDVARFWILYNFGGVYFDTDIELLRSIDDIVSQGPFMGLEAAPEAKKRTVNPGLGIAAPAGHPFYKKFLDFYDKRHFIRMDGKSTGTVTKAMSMLMEGLHFTPTHCENVFLIDDISIYPSEYFCPYNYYTGVLEKTDRTRSIHRYDSTWLDTNTSRLHKLKCRLFYIRTRVSVALRRLLSKS